MTTNASDTKPKAPGFFRQAGGDLWRFFTSIRLAIVLISLIILIGVVGTLIPQADKTRSVDYIERYGVAGYEWIKALQLDELFSSTYFVFVMALFFINMSACTYKRLRASARYARAPQKPKHPQAFERMPVHRVAEVNGDASGLLDKAQAVLSKRRYKVRREGDQLLAEKWRWERFGIDVFHLGILVLLVGGLLTATLGFRFFQLAHQGETFAIPQRDFVVRVDKFWSENYAETERVMDWHSTLTIIDGGKEALTETVEVNVPMMYDGIRLFQSSFGQDWENSAFVTVRVETDDGVVGEYEAKVDESFTVEPLDVRVKVGAFLSDFALTDNQIAYSRSQRLLNPAVFLQVYDRQDRLVHRTWAFSQRPELQDFLSDAPFRFYITGMTAPEFTGIQINYDPGYDVAIGSFVIMMAGILIHLYFKHRQVWVHVDPSTHRLLLGGRARQHSKGFEDEIDRIFKQISPDGQTSG